MLWENNSQAVEPYEKNQQQIIKKLIYPPDKSVLEQKYTVCNKISC